MPPPKIIFDKLKDDQEYPITPKEIRFALGLVPEFTGSVRLVHVQGRNYRDIFWLRPARLESNGKLIISALGLGKEEFVREILIEFHASRSKDWLLRPAKSRRLSKKQLTKINELVAPLVQRFVDECNP